MRLDRLYDAFRRRFGRWWIVPPGEDLEPSEEFTPLAREQLALLKPGDYAYLTFKGWPKGRIYHSEHHWVRVTGINGNAVTGILASDPDDLPQLRRRQKITFRLSDIIEFGPRMPDP